MTQPFSPQPYQPYGPPLGVGKGVSGFGIAALALGVVALIVSWIPLCGIVGMPLAGIGLILAIVGIIVSKAGGKSKLGMSIAGGILCLLAVAVQVAVTGGLMALGSREAKRQAAEAAKWATNEKPFTNTVGMLLVPIPPGEFDMGSPQSEAGRDKDETAHHVTLTKGFYLATTPVTQGQWKALMGTSVTQQRDKIVFPAQGIAEADPKYALTGEGDDLPMNYVAWAEAGSFCQKLSDKEHKRYRLPTEAEWEYACRGGDPRHGGTKTAFSFGDDEKLLSDYAWYADNSGGELHPVGTKKPNPLGLYDMHGNVSQWCSDFYDDYASGDAVGPTGPAVSTTVGSLRVLRGGSWGNDPGFCRAAVRHRLAPVDRYSITGLRVCLDPQ